jgi:hypothetical protein
MKKLILSFIMAAASQPALAQSFQEKFTLATANAAGSDQATGTFVAGAGITTRVYGGSYVLSQVCASYNANSLVLNVQAADNATFLPLVTKTGSDTTSGTSISLGAFSLVKVALPAGGTNCYVTLSRVPA